MTIGEPNFQTFSRISVPSAESGSETQPWPSMPKQRQHWLTRPSVPKICRHRIAIATLPPSSDGR